MGLGELVELFDPVRAEVLGEDPRHVQDVSLIHRHHGLLVASQLVRSAGPPVVRHLCTTWQVRWRVPGFGDVVLELLLVHFMLVAIRAAIQQAHHGGKRGDHSDPLHGPSSPVYCRDSGRTRACYLRPTGVTPFSELGVTDCETRVTSQGVPRCAVYARISPAPHRLDKGAER